MKPQILYISCKILPPEDQDPNTPFITEENQVKNAIGIPILSQIDLSFKRLAQKEALPELTKINGIIIGGSPVNVNEIASTYPWVSYVIPYLKECLQKKIPLLGICFGHQLIGHLFDCPIGRCHQYREIGTRLVQLTSEGLSSKLFDGLSPFFDTYMSHNEVILEAQNQLKVLAKNDYHFHQAIQFNNHTYGVQFHPEFTKEHVESLINQRQNRIRDEGINVEQLLKLSRDASTSHSILGNFIQHYCLH